MFIKEARWTFDNVGFARGKIDAVRAHRIYVASCANNKCSSIMTAATPLRNSEVNNKIDITAKDCLHVRFLIVRLLS